MARLRVVKPEFWASEQVIACSPTARLLFIGLWNFCDDNGIHQASYIRLKAEVFPIDNCTMADIKQWVDELIKNNLICEYVVDNKSYWLVTGWKRHQKIDKPTYRHPLPQSDLNIITDELYNQQNLVHHPSITHQAFNAISGSSRRIVVDTSGTESSLVESNRKNKDICKADALPLSDQKNSASNVIQVVFQHWQQVMNHPQAKLDKKRTTKIAQALKLGYSVDELKKAINGCARNPFNMGDNERKQKYDGIDLIFRDAEHIERFIQSANGNAEMLSNFQKNNLDIFAGVL